MGRKNTAIEQHYIAGHGSLVDFVACSNEFGSYMWTVDSHVRALQDVARIDDKECREIALGLIEEINMLNSACDELRRRFSTVGLALESINSDLQSPVGLDDDAD